MPHLANYLVVYLDILGQSEKLRKLERLPTTAQERQEILELLASTALTVKNLRGSFDRHFGYNAPSPEAIEMVPPDSRDEFRRAFGVQPWHRGFSDSVVITVPLAGTEEIDQVAGLVAVHRALHAVGVVVLEFLSATETPIRGGIDVGLGMEIFEREYYGRALVEAYLLERDHADYPRVLVGEGLFQYLAMMNEAPFSSRRLQALTRSTVQDCRDLLLADPEDGRAAVDPLWTMDDTEHPHHEELMSLGVRMITRVNDLAKRFSQSGEERLALKYQRLGRFLSASPHASLLN